MTVYTTIIKIKSFGCYYHMNDIIALNFKDVIKSKLSDKEKDLIIEYVISHEKIHAILYKLFGYDTMMKYDNIESYIYDKQDFLNLVETIKKIGYSYQSRSKYLIVDKTGIIKRLIKWLKS